VWQDRRRMHSRTSNLGSIVALALSLLLPSVARAEILVPAGFTVRMYVTGEGFETPSGSTGRGIPSTSTLLVDPKGMLYLARTGRRYSSGEYDYLTPMYRIPVGGARLTPSAEARYLHGPPLVNAQVSGGRGGQEILVTTFDRDRRVGVLYRLVDGRVHLFAGGTPEAGVEPALIQPEGCAVDTLGNVFVADRERGVVLRLDSGGQVIDPDYARITRPRGLVVD